MGENVVKTLIDTTLRYPDKTAIIESRKSITGNIHYSRHSFSNFLGDVKETADRLKDIGFKKGDRIIILVPMSYKLYVIIVAIFFIGAVGVFIDPWADKKRISDACKLIAPKGYIGCAKAFILMVIPEIRQIPLKALDISVFRTGGHNSLSEPVDLGPNDEALITLTTGTTGVPKGANRTHEFLYEQFIALGKHLENAQDRINLTALPIFVFGNLGMGITSALPLFNPAKPTAFNPADITRQIQDCGISTALGSPAFFDKIAGHLIANGITVPLSYILTGGAPVFKSLGRKLKKAFPTTDIDIVYGCTEAEPISSIGNDTMLEADSGKGICVGLNANTIDVAVIKALPGSISIDETHSFDSYLLARGEVGEIIVCGPNVLPEYFGSSELWKENKIPVNDRVWHRTGDAGMIDETGNICLHGRIKNPINSDGNTVYALPYEQKLMDIEGISFSAIYVLNGEVIVCIEPDTGLSVSENVLISRARKELNLKTDRIIIVKNIPKDQRHCSKVDFAKLSEIIHLSKYS